MMFFPSEHSEDATNVIALAKRLDVPYSIMDDEYIEFEVIK